MNTPDDQVPADRAAQTSFTVVDFGDGFSTISTGPAAVFAGTVSLFVPWTILGTVASQSVALGFLSVLVVGLLVLAVRAAHRVDAYERRLALRLSAVGLGSSSLLALLVAGAQGWPLGLLTAGAMLLYLRTPTPNAGTEDEPNPLRDRFGATRVGEQGGLQFSLLVPRHIAAHGSPIRVFVHNCYDAHRQIAYALTESSPLFRANQHLSFVPKGEFEVPAGALAELQIPVSVGAGETEATVQVRVDMMVSGDGGRRCIRWRGAAYKPPQALERVGAARRGDGLGVALRVLPRSGRATDEHPSFTICEPGAFARRLRAVVEDSKPAD